MRILIILLFLPIFSYSQTLFDTKEKVVSALKENKSVSDITYYKDTNNGNLMIYCANSGTKYHSTIYMFNSDSLCTGITMTYNYEYINLVVKTYNEKLTPNSNNLDSPAWVDYKHPISNVYYYLTKSEKFFSVLATVNPIQKP